ncbi:MAG: C4-dicarboxylate TRAP transporter large permease protein DctM [Syntrophomonadaceae bacterium]|nr:C4-dicarboxylate TRAP transporter large permease protein DctM [Bacillota bacterium]MBT9146827.1 C4-dicarboxylate TRAP transporter large permease protein DctM [Bacillota bacterium]
MSIEIITLLMFGSLVVLLATGLPIAFVTGGLAVLFTFFLVGPAALHLVVARIMGLMADYILVAIPMFIFMAAMLERSGIIDDMYEAMYQWMGSLRGGLAIGTVLICTILAAMVGIIGAAVVTMGLIALPVMLNRNYHKDIALGSICAGGTLGILIPPSILFIVYAVTAGVSVGRLFIGGVMPGLLLSGLYITYIGIRCFLRPNDGPSVSQQERQAISLRQKFGLLKSLILPVLLVAMVLGSIFGGIAAPTEAAGVGALGAILCTVIHRRFTWQRLKEASLQTIRATCMVLWTIFGAGSFVALYTMVGGADFVREVIMGLPLGPWGILIVMQIFLIFMGMFLDWVGILLLCVPIFVPIITELGFDPLWFGVLYNVNMQMSFLTPPFGYALFYLKGVAPEGVSMGDIYRAIWPFVILQAIGLALCMIFPQIITWLPGLMF